MTNAAELDALAQAIADAEMREGRPITEDDSLAVARILIAGGIPQDGIRQSPRKIVFWSTEIAIARAAIKQAEACND